MLEDLGAPAYKIASFEIIDLPLVKYVASKRKPMIISTGMANLKEILEAVNVAQNAGCQEIALLHCISGYPAPSSEYNLRTITDLVNETKLVVGLSDHTIENTVAIAAVALGCSIIEKHVTLDKNGGGPDDIFSLEPEGLKDLCQKTLIAWEALGKVSYSLADSEKTNVQFRRSLYFTTNLKLGEVVKSSDIKSVRPGFGLAPKYLETVIGKKLKVNVKKFSPVKENYFY